MKPGKKRGKDKQGESPGPKDPGIKELVKDLLVSTCRIRDFQAEVVTQAIFNILREGHYNSETALQGE